MIACIWEIGIYKGCDNNVTGYEYKLRKNIELPFRPAIGDVLSIAGEHIVLGPWQYDLETGVYLISSSHPADYPHRVRDALIEHGFELIKND